MKTGTKRVLFCFLLITLTCGASHARATSSWFEKIKSFFTQTSDAESATVVSEPTELVPSAPEEKKPVFDFSEKTIGNRSAPIKIHIFTSLTCNHCPAVHSQIMPHLEENYVKSNEAFIILEDFPIDARAMTASLISRCLTGDRYFAFIETLFENQRHWAFSENLQESILPYVKLAGLNEEDMLSCATNEEALKEVTRQRNLAIMRYKIHATPTLILQSGKQKKVFEGVPHIAELDKAIEELKKQHTGSWPSDGSAGQVGTTTGAP